MTAKTPRRGVQNTALGDLPGSALSSLVPPMAHPPAAPNPAPELVDASQASDVSNVADIRPHPRPTKPPIRRDPTKVNAELLQQMRNLTAFIRGRGRPMAELGELLDEALSEYLDRRRNELNEGQAFPYVGRLR